MPKKISRTFSILIMLANVGYFIPLTIKLANQEGETFGFEMVGYAIAFISCLFLIPAVLAWTGKVNEQVPLFLNFIGTVWITFWIVITL